MTELQLESLQRAKQNTSVANYSAIFEGFSEKGIAFDEIQPRVNVFTYNAWAALGRQVRKGEHGVRVTTWIPVKKLNKDTGKKEIVGRRPKTAVVFHVSQTDPVATAEPVAA